MSTTDDTEPFDERTGQELLEERFGDRRHVLERIVELDAPLSDDAAYILDQLDQERDQS